MKRTERLPRFLPAWIKERAEVNTYKLKQFVQESAAQIPTEGWVLDAGAGEGRFQQYFAHTRYVGVDVAIGSTDWDYSNLDVIADLMNLPFPFSTFDAVVCTQVLEHVPEPSRVLREIARVLKPGGRLYLSAPQSWHQHQKPYDYYRYTSFGLRYLVEQSGLSVESIQPLGGYFWFLSFQLQNLIYWTFSFTNYGRKWFTWPLRGILGLVFQLLLPLPLFYLDSLDHVQDETLGHVCVAIKPVDPTSR